jgi:hypothetical protein
MTLFIVILMIGLPLGMAIFLCWRAYQLTHGGRVNLTHQWLGRKTPGIEKYAKLFAIRDLLFATGCIVFICLLLTMPAYFSVWPGLLAAFAAVHQTITAFAVYKIQKEKKSNPQIQTSSSNEG